jgi:tripartite-type tricarboxylate transporter receptor subunit TctC
LLVPFAAAGGADVVMRPFISKLTEQVGQHIIYENRGGGGGVLAGEIVARAAPDGYTLLCGAVGVMTVTGNLMKMPFDPLNDFAPITRVTDVASLLGARPGLASRTLKEIVDYAKANPGKLVWGVTGIGAPGHLAMGRFRVEQGITVNEVFYKGAGPATVALISGEIDIMSANPGVYMPHIKAGRIRPIATSSAKRLAILPDIPTYAEAGFPGYLFASWYGLVAPARTPVAVINKLHAEVTRILGMPDVKERLYGQGFEILTQAPGQFGAYLKADILQWARVVKSSGATVD